MLSKKLKRAWGAVRIRYPIFQAINAHRALFIAIGAAFALALMYSVLWAFSIPQDALEITAFTGIPDNLFSTVIEVAILLSLGIGLLLWKTIATSDNVRINNNNSEIPDSLIFPVNPISSVEIYFDCRKHYHPPPILEACLRWVEFDRDEFYLVEAGSLDIPKLSLNTITVDSNLNKVKLELGSASFFDIFYTHYSPDLVLSSQSANESDSPTTLRTLFGKSIFQHYVAQAGNGSEETIHCSSLLPNPLGVSGIVLLVAGSSTFVLLRKRGSHEIAAKNRLEWSFAGLVEAVDWVHESKIDFEKFAKSELDDEVISKVPALNRYNPKIEPLGFVFNPLYLYQPEVFVAVKFAVKDEEIDDLRHKLDGSFLVVSVNQLLPVFDEYELKNLCLPGLKLLALAYPTLLSSVNPPLNPDAQPDGVPAG